MPRNIIKGDGGTGKLKIVKASIMSPLPNKIILENWGLNPVDLNGIYIYNPNTKITTTTGTPGQKNAPGYTNINNPDIVITPYSFIPFGAAFFGDWKILLLDQAVYYYNQSIVSDIYNLSKFPLTEWKISFPTDPNASIGKFNINKIIGI